MRAAGAAGLVAALMAMAGCGPEVIQAGNDEAGNGFTDVTVVVTTTVAVTPSTTPTGRYTVGDCVTWVQTSATSAVEVVACDTEHLVEVTAPLSLSTRYPDGTDFPSSAELAALAVTDCTAPAETYLGRGLDKGETPGVLLPSSAEWDSGDRASWCTVGLARVGGQRPPYRGSLRDQ
ncbi:MAG TPA: septum formation family protein [Acidimicrobiales bacterium]